MGVKKGTLGSGGLNRKVSQTCQPNRHFDARKIYLKYNIFDRCISHNQLCRFCPFLSAFFTFISFRVRLDWKYEIFRIFFQMWKPHLRQFCTFKWLYLKNNLVLQLLFVQLSSIVLKNYLIHSLNEGAFINKLWKNV